jgi:hypothetical protein
MNLLSIIKALRIGASLPNPTPIKWAGIFFAAMLIALQVAQHFGFLQEVSADDWGQLSLLLLILYSQVATTEKVGVFPREKRVDVLEHDFLDDPAVRVQPEPLPTDTLPSKRSDGFPDGPFFDNDR